jgi:hypothetical protein
MMTQHCTARTDWARSRLGGVLDWLRVDGNFSDVMVNLPGRRQVIGSCHRILLTDLLLLGSDKGSLDPHAMRRRGSGRPVD